GWLVAGRQRGEDRCILVSNGGCPLPFVRSIIVAVQQTTAYFKTRDHRIQRKRYRTVGRPSRGAGTRLGQKSAGRSCRDNGTRGRTPRQTLPRRQRDFLSQSRRAFSNCLNQFAVA